MTTDKREKIVVIEGDGDLGEKILSALRQNGYETTLIKTGTEALKGIIDAMPHLILLDIFLPGLDGYQVLKQKLAEPLLAKIPVFLMSSQGLPINMQEVPQGSVSEFLVALHADPSDIVDKVNRHFGHEARNTTRIATVGAPTCKLLWVEDDKLIGSILAKKLISAGFDLFHAKNGEEALEALKQTIPNVIVLDLLLPGMSGFDILQKIKMQGGALAEVPVMILSNLSKQSDIERAKTLGAKKFLVKAAASLDQIVSEIRTLCK